jgi:hypothetical protein
MITWNVVYYDLNEKDFGIYNVLNPSILNEIKERTKHIDNRKEFSEEVSLICMYHFWSKCEWEIVLREWCGGDNAKEMKVDVYDQLVMNWNRFIDYLWGELK